MSSTGDGLARNFEYEAYGNESVDEATVQLDRRDTTVTDVSLGRNVMCTLHILRILLNECGC